MFDSIKRRYFAAGSVYHACFREERTLLMVYPLSNFKASQSNQVFNRDLEKLLCMKDSEGYYVFDKSLVKEKRIVIIFIMEVIWVWERTDEVSSGRV